MSGFMYYGALIGLAIFIFTMMQSHHNILAFIALAVAVYLVYSHQTGNTATDFKNEMVEKINEETTDYKYKNEKTRIP